MKDEHDAIYAGLRALAEDAFPKRCCSCGRVYDNAETFLRLTRVPDGHSGLQQTNHGNDKTAVELYRSCVCGSTLMDLFGDRREAGEIGMQRRERFENLLGQLEALGLARTVARTELLNFLCGESSPIIERLLSR